MERPRLIHLFLAFLRLGTTAFGGPAMVVYIRDLAVRRHSWLNEETFDDGVALCQSIPGATAMQTAAYVGLKARGVPGALTAFLGFGLPSFLLMTALAALYLRYSRLDVAIALFSILQVIVVALIANATLLLGRGMVRKPVHAGLALLSALLFAVGTSPFLVILLGAALGAFFLRRGASATTRHTPHAAFTWRPVLSIVLFILAGLATAYLVNPRLFALGLVMLKVDCFAFGGGFAALPLMFHEVVVAKGWLTAHTFMDGIALGQITPGPIMITATFTGYLVEGIRGALTATAAVFAPSFLFLVTFAPLFDRFRTSPLFAGAAQGAFATFLGLLLYTTIHFGLLAPWNYARAAIAVLALIAALRRVDTFYIVLAGAVLSLFLK